MRRNTFRLALAGAGLLAALAGAQGAGAQEPAKQPTARGTGGAAATVDALGTQAAIDTLKAGGNAVDAAVAAAGVLGVTEPFSCGIGGGGFMVIRTADGDVTTIDGREKAPRAMKPDSFWENGKPLAFDPARFSGLSAGVPGTPLTWARALKKYGTISLRAGAAAGHPRRDQRLHGRQDLLRLRRGREDVLRRRPVDRGDLPRRRPQLQGRRDADHQPRHGQDLPAAGSRGRPQGLLLRRRGRGDGQGRHAAADRGRRRPHVAARPDDDRATSSATRRPSARPPRAPTAG